MGECCSRLLYRDSYRDKTKFRVVDGRRYHNVKNATYDLPNDDGEVIRLEEQHHVFRFFVNGNYHSPVHELLEEGVTVLDNGCGTGAWCSDMALHYPKSTFTGLDISPIFNFKPDLKNVRFVEGNVLDGLPFPDETFTFVYSRLLYASLTTEQWEAYISEALRVTKPGGWIEFHELDGHPYTHAESGDRLSKAWGDFLADKNIDVHVGPRLPGMMEASGQFESVHYVKIDMSLNPKNGKNCERLMNDVRGFLVALRPTLLSRMGITVEYYDALVEGCMHECKKNDAYIRSHQAYGRKKPIEIVIEK